MTAPGDAARWVSEQHAGVTTWAAFGVTLAQVGRASGAVVGCVIWCYTQCILLNVRRVGDDPGKVTPVGQSSRG